jgi:hypothetical protein
VRRTEVDNGLRPGLTDERERLISYDAFVEVQAPIADLPASQFNGASA